jgi:hypothetical protein
MGELPTTDPLEDAVARWAIPAVLAPSSPQRAIITSGCARPAQSPPVAQKTSRTAPIYGRLLRARPRADRPQAAAGRRLAGTPLP